MQLNAIKDLIKEHGLKSENNENGLTQREIKSLLESEKWITISLGALNKRLKNLQNCN